LEASLVEKSYRYIRQQLACGELLPGTRLVNRTLAAEIGVSVIPVREALHRLASEGLVDQVPGAGAFVRQVDPQELDDLYVLRDAIESCAASEAAKHATQEQLQTLEEVVAEAEAIAVEVAHRAPKQATKTQFHRWLDLEERFHDLIFEASRNRLLARVAGEHRAVSRIFEAQRDSHALLTADLAETTCRGKRELLAALQHGDSQRAKQSMSVQIQRGRSRVLQFLRGRQK
jgi:DNA-binding GntR family transcriptional regulator